MRTGSLARIVVAVCLLAGVSFGQSVSRHDGNADPTTEGWEFVSIPGADLTAGPITEGGVDAWFVEDLNPFVGALGYRQRPTVAQMDAAADRGWCLRVRLRVPNANDAVDPSVVVEYLSTSRGWIMNFGTDADGDPIVQLGTDIVAGNFVGPEYTLEGAGSGGYHLYELVHDPAAGKATLFVDGIARLTDYAGHPFLGDSPRVVFGALASIFTGRGHYALAEWEIKSFQLPFFQTGDLFAQRGNELYRLDVSSAPAMSLIGTCGIGRGGVAFDADGNLFATGLDGLRVYDRNFQLLGHAVINDPVDSTTSWPALRRSGQVVACHFGNPARLAVFDTSDLSNPVLSNVVVIPDSLNTSCRGVAVDASDTVWVCGSRRLHKLVLDAAGTLVSAELVLLDINPVHLAFQPGANRLFLCAVNDNDVVIVDPADPTVTIATITDICDLDSNSPAAVVFDSAGNLFVGCSGSSGQITDILGFPAASVAGLSGTVAASALGPIPYSDINGGVAVLGFKPAGKSRDPFTIDAGNNITILSQDQATTSLVGTITSDPLGETFRGGWLFNGEFVAGFGGVLPDQFPFDLSRVDPLPVGDHVFTYEVNGCCLIVRDTVVVTIENSPPTAAPIGASNCPDDENVVLGGQVADFDGDVLSYEWRLGLQILASGVIATTAGGAPVTLPDAPVPAAGLGVGVYTIDLVVDDGVNDEVSASILVEVCPSDTTAPTCAPVPSTSILWPPNHQMQEVTIDVNAADDSGGPVSIGVEVASSESPDDTEPDIEILEVDAAGGGFIRLDLRSERAGQGDGRVYMVTITVTDEAGNASTCEVEIQVPHDKGGS